MNVATTSVPVLSATRRLEGIPAAALPSNVSVIERDLLSVELPGALEKARMVLSMTLMHAWMTEGMCSF